MKKYIGDILLILGIIGLFAAVMWPVVIPESVYPEDAVVYIDTYGWTGSGVCIDESGIILTAAHILDGAWETTIRFPDGRKFTPYDVYIDNDRDIAFCRIDPNGVVLPALSFGNSDAIIPGDAIEIIGAPLGIGWWHAYGHISKIAYNGDIYMDIAGNPGNSGCPVLYKGQIVGILTCGFLGADGLLMGIESNYIQLVLAKYKFFDDVNAQSLFLDFSEWTNGWLLKEFPVL